MAKNFSKQLINKLQIHLKHSTCIEFFFVQCYGGLSKNYGPSKFVDTDIAKILQRKTD